MASHNSLSRFHLHKNKKAGSSKPPSTLVPSRADAEKLKADIKKHQQREHLAEATAVAAGVFALHEKKQAKKHPENAHSHKMKEQVAGAIALGAGVAALHENHQKNKAKKLLKHLRRH